MLLTLEAAKDSLRIPPEVTEFDALVLRQVKQASAIVAEFIKRPDHGWDADTVPFHIQGAVVHVLHRLHEDPLGEREGGYLPEHVQKALEQDRPPSFA